ncbi:MAG: phenylalanine--tRNA ligase subunit alpha [Candidatus Magasanikbacteria bacterium CG_4_9_14_0_2_um_filter_42_11]|uniref:Phenylalanine--tRNA ligase alpha subunit n=1 Tax=Candidatus Magasanikbacteria bacterium CG_4_9_14_0_2_um_filter_42_11 TaxID=1974643 RepID=A0A2M8F9Z1_9BACT|nr:MAG: phenylalanine--tRNA ligase subunit alpha [Candidatus Magasanikbacteria bacterium CG10_big_fil_rev_8_21_14_0_10_43_9]PIY92732.1 MAG: phenylalanine--tRNA ligase subunit alpha [Candidatus Magasanikbacteria bacterium CG_4_10_14_0_8_um_filter_42_12]PJC52545.1 MAG: phenylalanine--tRNA ligase subunit alpha [Candidatus Magasanikbacteria bacterium CG_4_9_14_0_2_um_filter_42_11]
MKEQLSSLKKEFEAQLKHVSSLLQLEALEQTIFGRKAGAFTTLAKQMKDVATEQKKAIGEMMNTVRLKIVKELEEKREALQREEMKKIAETESIDVTEPHLPKEAHGHMHPMSQVEIELSELFRSMGFMVLDGPELESDYFNFEALNIPPSHPARDSHDTFFIKDHPEWVMRTHTSPVQVRAMRQYGAPLRAVVPGRVFRNESTDASHEHTFTQLEGLVVDTDISIADIIGVMKGLLTGILKREVEVRLRPGYFPFVEPGFELDMKCLVCDGKGCNVCKHTGWVEMMPCGLVHPEVLKAGGLDPDVYSGFAFGLGSMRLVMQKYGIEDIRHFQSGDLRFLKQF